MNKIIPIFIISILLIPAITSGSYIENSIDINIKPLFAGNETINYTQIQSVNFYKNGYSGRIIKTSSPYSTIYNITNLTLSFKIILPKSEIMNGIANMVLMLPTNETPNDIKIYRLGSLGNVTNENNVNNLYYHISQDLSNYVNFYNWKHDNRSYIYLPYVALQPNIIYKFFMTYNQSDKTSLYVNDNSINVNNLLNIGINNNEYQISPDIQILITKFMSYTYSNIEAKNYNIVEFIKNFNTPIYSTSHKGKIYSYMDYVSSNNENITVKINGGYESSSSTDHISETLHSYGVFYEGNTSSTYTSSMFWFYYYNYYKNIYIPLILDNSLNKFVFNTPNFHMKISSHFRTSATILYTEQSNYIPDDTTISQFLTQIYHTIIDNTIFEKPLSFSLKILDNTFNIRSSIDNIQTTLQPYIYQFVNSKIYHIANNYLSNFYNNIINIPHSAVKFVTYHIHTVLHFLTNLYENQISALLSQIFPVLMIIFFIIPFVYYYAKLIKFISLLLRNKLNKAEKYMR